MTYFHTTYMSQPVNPGGRILHYRGIPESAKRILHCDRGPYIFSKYRSVVDEPVFKTVLQ